MRVCILEALTSSVYLTIYLLSGQVSFLDLILRLSTLWICVILTVSMITIPLTCSRFHVFIETILINVAIFLHEWKLTALFPTIFNFSIS